MAMAAKGKKAQWTVLAYLAGDNDLEGAAIKDINEMEVVGSREGVVDILVQVDRAADYDRSNDDWRSARRYYITQGVEMRRITSKLLADLGETNTGDPRILKDFIRYGVQSYPAQQYLLILWNHGSGFYVPPEMLVGEGAPSRREITLRAAAKLRRSFFHSARRQIFELPPKLRGICYDDGSSDCLDNKELKGILQSMSQLMGKKVDVVGMDACLMTNLEVAYQIKDYARFLVGSEETEPADGWPYNTILKGLADNPKISSRDFGRVVVDRYIESYDKPGPFDQDVTQAALDLEKLGDLVQAVDTLAKALLAKLPSSDLDQAIYAAWRRSTRFFDNFYVDLHHFASALAQNTTSQEVQKACREVANAIEGKGAQTPLVAEKHLGPGMQKVKGISIYFPPFKNPSVFYKELDFANDIKWGDFLSAYLEEGR
ncbi:MAG: hypothetical protein HY347_07780 [candidate division NC10 bacterium]|nr:hypothetical protein [candidate division NC10 bacterium]